ncbi:MAG: IS66 family transposase [Oligoflexia bacterium]|nr:IS66 family transposase [Oligoflexia bacterium]
MTDAAYLELIKKDPAAVSRLLVEKDREILKLQQHLLNANKVRFGTKSEKLSTEEQQKLFPVTELEEPAQEVLPTIVVPEHTRKKRTRRQLPADTLVTRIVHPPAATQCSCCGGELTQIREETTKILEYVPARFELQEHVRPVMACNHCKESAPVTTKLPAGVQLIDRCPAGVGLLSYILLSKYQDHLPLHRLEGIFARLGFELPRSRMCDWLAKLAEVLQPLHLAAKLELLKQHYLQADETTVKIQDGETEGKCHTGYFWGVLGPPPLNLVYFHYADSRAGEVPKALLSDFRGTLQTDLYAGYNQVYVPEQSVRAGCWAHVRRKFLEIQKLAPKADVNKTLELIARLYRAEPEGKPPDAAAAARKRHAAPILEKLQEHLLAWSARTLPSSEVQKAIHYALSQWDALSLFVNDSAIRLDNNLIENQMRPIALGRKNWLFAGSHEGAMRAAIFFSIINSCRLNKVNTWHYFNDVLPRIQSTPRDQMAQLLPHRWKATVKDAA